MAVVILNLSARAFNKDPDKAFNLAARRLADAADNVLNRKIDTDPGIDLVKLDPGGGGGPCAPEFIEIPINVSASGLPETQNGDDDD